jgi:hypothetical protein
MALTVIAGGSATVGRQKAKMVVGFQIVYQWGAVALQLTHNHSQDNETIETIVVSEDSYYHYLNLFEVPEQPYVSSDATINHDTNGDYSFTLSGVSCVGWELNAHKILVYGMVTSSLEI